MKDHINIYISNHSLEEINIIKEEINKWTFNNGLKYYDNLIDNNIRLLMQEDIIDIVFIQVNNLKDVALIKRIRKSNQRVVIFVSCSNKDLGLYLHNIRDLFFSLDQLNTKVIKLALDQTVINTIPSRRQPLFISDHHLRVIDCNEVLYIKAKGHQSIIHMFNNISEKNVSIGLFENSDYNKMVRISKSYIVNLNYIIEIKNNYAIMPRLIKLPISRKLTKEIKNKFNINQCLKCNYQQLFKDDLTMNIFDYFDDNHHVFDIDIKDDYNYHKCQISLKNMQNTIERNGIVIGVFSNELLIGYALLESDLFGSDNQYVLLSDFYISSRFTNLGIGQELINRITNYAKNLTAKKIYLSYEDNDIATSFYRNNGWVTVKENHEDYINKLKSNIQIELEL